MNQTKRASIFNSVSQGTNAKKTPMGSIQNHLLRRCVVYSYHFAELYHEFAIINENGIFGIDMDHEFYIFHEKVIDTFNIKWHEWNGPVGECCKCTSFPVTYFKWNGELVDEGSDVGSVIIRVE